jgi:hypothetical protein
MTAWRNEACEKESGPWIKTSAHLDYGKPQHMLGDAFALGQPKPTPTDEDGTTHHMKKLNNLRPRLSEQTTRPKVVDAMLPFEDGKVIEFTFSARSRPALYGSKMVFFLPSGWRKERKKKRGTVYVSPSGTQLRTSPISRVAYESQDRALVSITNRFIVPGGSVGLTECQALISPQFIEPTVALTEMTNIASSQPPAKRQRTPSAKAR